MRAACLFVILEWNDLQCETILHIESDTPSTYRASRDVGPSLFISETLSPQERDVQSQVRLLQAPTCLHGVCERPHLRVVYIIPTVGWACQFTNLHRPMSSQN